MKATMLHLRLVKGVKYVPLANMARQHVKVVHILPQYSTYLNLDKDVIDSTPRVDINSNLQYTQDCIDRAYVS